MQVFKLCLKIIKKNIPPMLIYVAIFLAISLIMSSSMTKEQPKETSFTPVKSNIALISEESSPLIDGLKMELAKIANFVELPDETEALQDALYFRSVSYILRIPEGFTESFMKGENLLLEKTIVPNSISNTYIDLSIDKYFNTARLYVQQLEGITQESLVQHLNSDLSEIASVELQTIGEKPAKQANHTYANYFFNYLVYSLLCIIILGMNTLMLVFNNQDLKRRNACSPISINKINLQFILANLLFTLAAWLIMVFFCFLFNYQNSFNMNMVYYLLNSFVFALCCSSISFLIGNLLKGQELIPAISNVVALGFCFISGVFVPQQFLGSLVLEIASFTPSYWFVKANNQIAELTQFDFAYVEPIVSGMLIQVGFTLAFFTVALVIGKKKSFS
ncbi:MAG: ABC transporter permease [Desulfosporosinus sp.]|jgi:ABC-2 type transport system permease protein